MQKIVTILPEDTFGISKILPDYAVETKFLRVACVERNGGLIALDLLVHIQNSNFNSSSKPKQSSTKVEISHYYSSTWCIDWRFDGE